jgi:hypothetical protein
MTAAIVETASFLVNLSSDKLDLPEASALLCAPFIAMLKADLRDDLIFRGRWLIAGANAEAAATVARNRVDLSISFMCGVIAGPGRDQLAKRAPAV